MVISKKIGDVYFFNKNFDVNQALTFPAFFDYNFTDTTVQATGGPYETLISINRYVVTQNTGVVPQGLKI